MVLKLKNKHILPGGKEKNQELCTVNPAYKEITRTEIFQL
jgi:hypothetical protein